MTDLPADGLGDDSNIYVTAKKWPQTSDALGLNNAFCMKVIVPMWGHVLSWILTTFMVKHHLHSCTLICPGKETRRKHPCRVNPNNVLPSFSTTLLVQVVIHRESFQRWLQDKSGAGSLGNHAKVPKVAEKLFFPVGQRIVVYTRGVNMCEPSQHQRAHSSLKKNNWLCPEIADPDQPKLEDNSDDTPTISWGKNRWSIGQCWFCVMISF